MTDLLERTTPTARHVDAGPVPPSGPSSEERSAPWPRRAKVLIAVLAVLALVGAFGTAYFAATGDDTDVRQQQLDDLVEQRDELLVEQQGLVDDLADATAQVTALSAELEAVTAERDALSTADIELQAQLDDAERAVADLERELVATADAAATLDERIVALGADVAALMSRALTAEAERDSLAELFPLTVDTTLAPADVLGRWDLTWVRHYDQGLAVAPTDPGFRTIAITLTADAGLLVDVPGHFTAGLARADGGLVALGRSTAALPACNGIPRVADVTLTLYGVDVTVEMDGQDSIDRLGATVVVSAPATDACPAGIAAFGATLTP